MSEGIELQPVGSSKPDLPPRHPDTKPGTLGAAYRAAEDKAKAAVALQEGGLDSISVWGLATAAWFAILALPLLLFPRILLFFAQTPPAPTNPILAAAQDRDHYDALTPLESFLCLTLSLGLLSMSLFSIFVIVPSYTPPGSNPSRWPALAVQVGLLSIVSVVTWNSPIGGLATLLGLGNTIVALWGWWVVAFGQGRTKAGHKSRKSPFPKNAKQRWEKL